MLTRTALSLLLALSLTNCGGGGGGDDSNNALFAGDFFVCSIQGLLTTSIDVDSNWGTGNANGAGIFAGSTMQNDDGVVTGPFDFSLPYFLDEDRIAAFNGNIWQGGFNADGSIGSLATIVEGSIPQLLMLVKQSGTLGNGSLDGAYRYGFWRRDGAHICSVGTMTFDGGGNWTATVEFENVDGTVASSLANESGTYLVNADGSMELDYGTDTLQGGVKEDGEAAFLGGTDATGGFPAKLILLRAATGASAATFDGDYYVTGFGRAIAAGYESTVGLMQANGNNGFEFNFSTNPNSGPIAPGATSGTSSVSGDGTLSIDFGPQFVGGIVASGNVGFLAGGTSQSSSPVLLFLIRR